MLRKCPHSVYVPGDMPIPADLADETSPYCTFCHGTPDRMIKLRGRVNERESDEKKALCPICCCDEFYYESDDKEYFCPRCGFDNWMLI